MNSLRKLMHGSALLLGAVLCMLCFGAVAPTVAVAQAQVTMTMNLPAYDFIWLADFIDFASNKLKSTAPNIFLNIQPTAKLRMYLVFKVDVDLKSVGKGTVATATLEEFDVPAGGKTLSANDFSALGTGGIGVRFSEEDKDLRKKIEDYATNLATAPVGSYTVNVWAYLGGDNFAKTKPLGSTSTTINITNTSAGEVNVSLTSPENGENVPNLYPTVSWTSEKPNVILEMYRMRLADRNPQDAINGGDVLLKKELSGVQSFTYPTDAPRRLAQNDRVAWRVLVKVQSNRAIEEKTSEARFFRIKIEDPIAQILSNFFSNLGGNAAGTWSTLETAGWTNTGTVTVDGRTMTAQEFQAYLTQLSQKITQQGLTPVLRVESQ
ncbi:MAG: hypothetical protein V1799_18610 [bacterium]